MPLLFLCVSFVVVVFVSPSTRRASSAAFLFLPSFVFVVAIFVCLLCSSLLLFLLSFVFVVF